jgi:hypothetical protein
LEDALISSWPRKERVLLTGGHDEPVIELNREAMRQMPAHVELEIIPGATISSRSLARSSKCRDWLPVGLRAISAAAHQARAAGGVDE